MSRRRRLVGPTVAVLALAAVFAAHVGCGSAEAAVIDLYVSNNNTQQVTEFTSSGTFVKQISTTFNNNQGLAFDSSGNLYVAESGQNIVQKITPTGSRSTFASGLSTPQGLAFDSSGNLYVANGASNTIVKVTPGGSSSVFATDAALGHSSRGLAFDSSGNLYVGVGTVCWGEASVGTGLVLDTGFVRYAG